MRKLFFILSLLLAAYLVVVALYFPQKEEAPICRKVDIHLNSDEKSKSLISKEQILQEINEIDSVPIGRIVTSYNTNRLEHALQSKNALVSECNLFFRPNGTLSVRVNTQYPLFLLQTNQEAYFITAKLRAIPTTRANAMVIPLPLVYGAIEYPPTAHNKTKALFEAVVYVLAHPKWGVYFSDFYVDNTQNLFLSGAVAGFVVEIGRDWTKIATQLKELDLFLSRVEPKMGCNAFSKISLIVPGRIIATPRQMEQSTHSSESISSTDQNKQEERAE